ncbi:hypothetical protein B0I37DRAFT_197945 [Chaetomium sp. MPI-CAGE-AT-0009]|nr:hypothetical protein B0I37DRAFT_197945 [Chaetomium sp. MPI-CAGE-AT-0009]
MASRSSITHRPSAFMRGALRAISSTPNRPPQPTLNPGDGTKSTDALPSQKQTAAQSGAELPGPDQKKKTQQEMDEELRQKLEGISGDGGASGVVYEDGKPVAMKRSVRENMFRYI